jgi:hypothetical protein
MQIDIKLVPFYERGFEAHFPKLAKLFHSLDYAEPFEKETSLYVLVDSLQRMSRDPKIPSNIKQKTAPFLEKLRPLKEKARELLLSRHLNELDRLLYQMEDEFEDLEKSL